MIVNTIHPCRLECQNLLAFLEQLPSHTPEEQARNLYDQSYENGLKSSATSQQSTVKPESSFQDRIDNLRSQILVMLSDPELETLKGEKALEILANEIRQLWISIAHKFSAPHFKSPRQPSKITLPSGHTISYPYERNATPDALEERLAQYCTVPPGWEAEHLLFSSGMATITSFFQGYLAMVRQSSLDPVKLLMWGGYFETIELLQYLNHNGISSTVAPTQETLQQKIIDDHPEILFLEPVSYSYNLEVLDLEEILSLWCRYPSDKPRAFVIDTTLVGESIDIGQLIANLEVSSFDYFIQIRSGLKLHQQGLEFSNFGIISIYSPQTKTPNSLALLLKTYLQRIRQTIGTELSLYEIALLDVPCFLNRKSLLEYSENVFTNNSRLAQSVNIQAGGIFRHIAHPSISKDNNQVWACAPFVFFYLTEPTPANYYFLLSIINHETNIRGLSLLPGSSFGFRHHRFEVIWPAETLSKTVLKVAMGARNGPSCDGTIELIKELATYPNFAALYQKYQLLYTLCLMKAGSLPGVKSH